MAKYELWYADDLGNRLAYINDISSIEYVKVLGSVGYFAITFPKRGQVYDSAIPDRRVAIYRMPIGGAMALDFMGLARSFNTVTSQTGLYQTKMHGYDPTELLKRRIVPYYAGSAEASMTDYADDMMKAIVRDNFIDNADYSGTPSPARDIDSYGFSVQADNAEGDTLTKAFAWRNVLDVLQDIQADSKAAGNEVFFGVIPVTEKSLEFRTWTSGNDRTVNGTNPLIFSLEWGNLVSPSLVDDYKDEANFIYAGGRGEKDARIVQTASDSTRMTTSVFNRCEGFAYSNGETSASVLSSATNELERRRPSTRLSAELIDTPLAPYGGLYGWNVGDRVTVNYAGRQFNVRIRAVHVKMDARGRETIRAKIEQ